MPSPHRAAVRGALALSAVLLLARPWFIVHRAFDVDEFEHAHAAWSLAAGAVPYRDFFEHHTPALYVLTAPLLAVLQPHTSVQSAVRALLTLRVLMWLLAIAAAALTFRIAAKWHRPSDGARGAVAVMLLATSWQFVNTVLEFRPDVPAVVCLLVAVASTFEAEDAKTGSPAAWFSLAGFAFGMSVLFTQKTVFAGPGLLIAAAAAPDRRAVVAFLAAAALPIAATFTGFAMNGAGMMFLDASVARNIALTADRMSPAPRLFASVMRNLPLYGLGIAGAIAAWRAGATGARRGLLISLATLAAGVVVIGRVYDQYYLLMLPLLAILAADFLLRAPVVARLGASGAIAAVAIAACSLWVAVSVSAFVSNDGQIDEMRFVMERTRASDTILSGVPGAGSFRPHAWYYFFLSGPFADGGDYARLAQDLEARRVNPRMVIFDTRVSAMPPAVLDYLHAHYRPVRGDIYERVD